VTIKLSINSKSCTTFTADVQNVRRLHKLQAQVCTTGRRSGLWRSCSSALRRCGNA